MVHHSAFEDGQNMLLNKTTLQGEWYWQRTTACLRSATLVELGFLLNGEDIA